MTDGPVRMMIHASPIRPATILVANVGFGLALLVYAKEHEAWKLYASCAVFTVLSAAGLFAVLFRRALLTLDMAGVRLESGRKTRWALAWGDIVRVGFVDTRINNVRTKRVVMLIDRQGHDYRIASHLTVTPDQLAALIHERREPF